MDVRDEEGQSIIEFCLMLPLMVILAVTLIRVNMAMQVSIVNQQYARAQTLFLTMNSPVYPALAMRDHALTKKGYNQMILGVSDNTPEEEDQDNYAPIPTIQTIGRKKHMPGESDEAGDDIKARSKVRIRTTVSLCTQQNILADGNPILPLNVKRDSGGGVLGVESLGPSNLRDNAKFAFCRSALE